MNNIFTWVFLCSVLGLLALLLELKLIKTYLVVFGAEMVGL